MDTLFIQRTSEIDMDLEHLQITAPLGSEHRTADIASRVGRLAVAYAATAFAGAFLVALVAMLVGIQQNAAVDSVTLLRALSGICAVFAVGFLVGRMKRKAPR